MTLDCSRATALALCAACPDWREGPFPTRAEAAAVYDRHRHREHAKQAADADAIRRRRHRSDQAERVTPDR